MAVDYCIIIISFLKLSDGLCLAEFTHAIFSHPIVGFKQTWNGFVILRFGTKALHRLMWCGSLQEPGIKTGK